MTKENFDEGYRLDGEYYDRFGSTSGTVGSNSGSSDEFYMDTSRVSDIAQSISDTAKKYGEKINDLTKTISDIGSYWTGSNYNSLKSYYSDYIQKLDQVRVVLETFSTILRNKVDNTSMVATRVANTLGGN